MIQRTLFLILALFLTVFVVTQEALAQFEGHIEFRAYEPGQPANPERLMTFTATPDRLMLKSGNQYRVFAGLDADALLIRNDRQDFVFLSGSTSAMRITKDEVDSLILLLQRMQGGSNAKVNSFDWESRFVETGEKKELLGHQVEKFNVYEENSDNRIAVWLTDRITINWGVLQNTWDQTLSKVVEADIPVEVFMNRKSFPLQIEYYENGRLTTVVEATQIDRSPVNPETFDLPENIRMMGITDLMMNMMRERR